MNAGELIFDVASFGTKYLPKIIGIADDVAPLADDAVQLAKTDLLGSFGVGRKLARTGRLAEVDAQKAYEIAQGMKALPIEGAVVGDLSDDFVELALNRAKELAQNQRELAVANGYNPNAMRLGEAIGVTQNAVGRFGGAFGKVMESPAGLPLMFAPDMLYLASMMSQRPNPSDIVPQPQGQQYY
jgi:hypothetical protein